MKRIAAALFFLGTLILAMILVVNSLTTGMAKTGDEFLIAVKNGHVDTARNYLSTGFRNAVTPEEFRTFLRAGGLDRYQAAAWSSRDYTQGIGRLEGVIYLDDGSVQPLKLLFVQEQDEWRIQSIEAPLPGITPRIAEKSIPPLPVLERMASESVNILGNCVRSGDFDPLQASISRLWQSRTSPARLRQAFAPFVDQRVDLSQYTQTGPVFSEPPSLDADSTLVLKGYFPHEAGTLSFTLNFTFEYPEWKLLGLQASL